MQRLKRLSRDRASRLALLCLFIVHLNGCGDGSGSGEWYTDWDIAGGCASDQGGDTRTSGTGTEVDVCHDVGGFDWIWVTYAAPWCSASNSQAAHIRTFQDSIEPDVALYTVLTSGHEPFSAATISHARAWASAKGLPPDHVLAEESIRTIPQHLLIGPDGRTYYRYVGFLQTEDMLQLLDDFRRSHRVPDVRPLPAP